MQPCRLTTSNDQTLVFYPPFERIQPNSSALTRMLRQPGSDSAISRTWKGDGWFCLLCFLSSVSIEEGIVEGHGAEGGFWGTPGSGRSRMLGKSKYDHTMGGSQGEWGRVRGSGAPPQQRKAQGPLLGPPCDFRWETQACVVRGYYLL